MPKETNKTYKNISGTTQELIGVGLVEAGGTIETSAILNNGNFELVVKPKVETTKKPDKQDKQK